MDNATEDAQSATTDRLQDINPQDIDRVEVIRGAAAATLYGTEASSGVIQIFTKRGQTGAPVYAFSTDLQHLSFPRAFRTIAGTTRPSIGFSVTVPGTRMRCSGTTRTTTSLFGAGRQVCATTCPGA